MVEWTTTRDVCSPKPPQWEVPTHLQTQEMYRWSDRRVRNRRAEIVCCTRIPRFSWRTDWSMQWQTLPDSCRYAHARIVDRSHRARDWRLLGNSAPSTRCQIDSRAARQSNVCLLVVCCTVFSSPVLARPVPRTPVQLCQTLEPMSRDPLQISIWTHRVLACYYSFFLYKKKTNPRT